MYCKYSERLQSLVRTECTDLSHSQASWPSSNNQQVVVIILRWRPCWRVHDSDTGNLPLLLILKAQTHKTNTKNTLSEEGLWPQLCLAVGWTWVCTGCRKMMQHFWLAKLTLWEEKKKEFHNSKCYYLHQEVAFLQLFCVFPSWMEKKDFGPQMKTLKHVHIT